VKKKSFLAVILFILFGFLIPFFSSPSLLYRTFPQGLIARRRTDKLSPGWEQENEDALPPRKILGLKDLPFASLPSSSEASPVSFLASSVCQEKLSSWLVKQKGQWGVVIYDLVQKEKFSFGGEKKFHAASVMKLVTAVSVFDWLKENQKELDFLVWGQSLRQRLTLLINKSDNQQWADLGALVTLKRSQRILEENGLTGSNIYSNTMTAEDVFLLLKKIYEGRLLDKESRNFLFSLMQNTINEKRIPQGVPAEIPVIHKYGTWQAHIHDAGIVFEENPYILVVLTRQAPQAEAKIAEFSAQVYQIFSQGKCSLK
jgi:beta-lactamase class A